MAVLHENSPISATFCKFAGQCLTLQLIKPRERMFFQLFWPFFTALLAFRVLEWTIVATVKTIQQWNLKRKLFRNK